MNKKTKLALASVILLSLIVSVAAIAWYWQTTITVTEPFTVSTTIPETLTLAPGDTVTYTMTVVNTGTLSYTATPTYEEVSNLNNVLYSVSFSPLSTVIPAGATQIFDIIITIDASSPDGLLSLKGTVERTAAP